MQQSCFWNKGVIDVENFSLAIGSICTAGQSAVLKCIKGTKIPQEQKSSAHCLLTPKVHFSHSEIEGQVVSQSMTSGPSTVWTQFVIRMRSLQVMLGTPQYPSDVPFPLPDFMCSLSHGLFLHMAKQGEVLNSTCSMNNNVAFLLATASISHKGWRLWVMWQF